MSSNGFLMKSDLLQGYQRKAGQKGTDYYPAKELRC